MVSIYIKNEEESRYKCKKVTFRMAFLVGVEGVELQLLHWKQPTVSKRWCTTIVMSTICLCILDSKYWKDSPPVNFPWTYEMKLWKWKEEYSRGKNKGVQRLA